MAGDRRAGCRGVVHAAAGDCMEEEMTPYPATVNDEAVYGHAKPVAESMIGEANVRLCPQFMAAEDIDFYSHRIPPAFFSVGVSNAETGKIRHMHSPHLEIDEAGLPIGAALHAAVAIEYLNKQASTPSCS